MNFKVFHDRVKIYDGYQIPKSEFDHCLDVLTDAAPQLQTRSRRMLKYEWALHNVCFKLGILMTKTRDVDLNFTPVWYESLFYILFGFVAMIIVK